MDIHTLPLELWYGLIFAVLLFLGALLLGPFIFYLFDRKQTIPVFGLLEKSCYKLCGVQPDEEMHWSIYAKSLSLFNLIGFGFIFFLEIFQYYLPLNPQHLPGLNGNLAFNVAASFTTNTNWQSYAGETTLSYLTQMLGLGVQNFFSAASGICVLMALIRGIVRSRSPTVGNFWSDLVRTVVYLLLPLAIVLSLALVSQGAVQSFATYAEVHPLEGGTQMIPFGPAASQIAIKQLGSNGGGFFNANSSHPFENPSAISNFLEAYAILLIPAALVYAYGLFLRNQRHSWLLFGVMGFLWTLGLGAAYLAAWAANPIPDAYPALEGMETRFGISPSVLWSVSTTATSNGSVNAMLSSLAPLVGGVALFNMMAGELIFGGVGVGLCSMIMFVLLTVFLSGLMVGRTPEYFGKKIEKNEIQWVMAAILTPGALILLGAGISVVLPQALSSLSQGGPPGFSEILYAFTSAAANNGSAFAGLNANTTYYNLVLGVIMILARLAILIPSLVIAGSLGLKIPTPPSQGTFTTDNFLFALLLVSVILIVGILTFFPALSLGPIVEHYLMIKGQSF